MLSANLKLAVAGVICGLALSLAPVQAGGLKVAFTDQDDDELEHAVLNIFPLDETASVPPVAPVVMSQKRKLFNPFVLPVRAGGAVEFTNGDRARHHVYSFSKAKAFELKLFGRGEKRSVPFESPGVVPVGCNIHDNMLAFIYVTNAPYYAVSDDDGMAEITDLPDGDYRVQAWHVDLEEEPKEFRITVSGGAMVEQALVLTMKDDRQVQRRSKYKRYD